MPTEFHRRARLLLEQVAALPVEQREPFLATQPDDPAILAEVRSLLPHFELMRDFRPQHPQGTGWQVPGTTTCDRIHSGAARDLTAAEERAPPFTIDRYTVLEILGRGGMGVVYRAVHPTLHRQVAIKILRRGLLNPETRHRFKFEEEVLRQLQHPNIARFVHGGLGRMLPTRTPDEQDDWRPFFVMEFIAGRPLTRFAREHRLDTRARLRLLTKVCDAVEYAHHRGIIHRDLKPDNILVQPDGEPKVLDFGIAHIPALDSHLTVDREGCFAGTIAYASPEQLAGRLAAVAPPSDVFTLGLIAIELLTHRRPQRAPGSVTFDVSAVALSDAAGHPDPRTPEFRYWLAAILGTAVRSTLGQPYQSAGELGMDLARLLDAYPALTGWQRWKARVASWFQPPPTPEEIATRRPLRAVLRKRIAMGLATGTPTSKPPSND
ncbi:MAG: serine/threonine protein kinase [Phycisphaerales bacterium]|nr:serine/threonine protein kinase [Phycisphaerales bacterium]